MVRAMLRVLVLSSRYPDRVRPQLGSFVERVVLALAARRDVAIEVVAPLPVELFPLSLRERNRRLAGIREEEMWNGVRVHRPRYLVPPRMGWLAPKCLQRRLLPLLSHIRERFPFDLIAAQFFWPEGPAAARLARRFGVPVSIKARGHDVEPAPTKQSRALIGEVGRAADGLLAVSAPVRDRMVALGMPAERIAIHRTGLDRTLFACRDREQAKAALGVHGPCLLWAGNLVARKRPLLAVETLALLPEAILLMAGGGPELHAVRRRIGELGLGSRVRVMGPLPATGMAQVYAAADLTLHTAESEGLSNVWVESLACGTPIVLAELEAARPLLRNPEAGLMAAPEPEALAAAVREVLRRGTMRSAIAAAVADYSWERSAAELEEHFRTIVSLP